MNDFACKVIVDASKDPNRISIGQQHMPRRVFLFDTVPDGKQLCYALGFFGGASLQQLSEIPDALNGIDSRSFEFDGLTITIQKVAQA